MTTMTKTLPATLQAAGLTSPLAAIAFGLALLFVSGFAGAEMLHNSAHDTRHATGFPCH